jgi:RNA polymerase sigma-70 factor, ECF subfamily
MQSEAVSQKVNGTEAPEYGRDSSVHDAAFSELVKMHWAQVFRICLRITRNEHDAEDAAQDSFLRAFANFHQFQGRAQFSTWLVSIARNCSLMLLRRRRVRPEIQMDLPESEGGLRWFEPSDSNPDQLSRVLYEENRARFIRSIAALPANLRSIADLIILNELTLEEAGRILEISDGCVKSRLYRARRRLSRFDNGRARGNIAHHHSIGGPVKNLIRQL